MTNCFECGLRTKLLYRCEICEHEYCEDCMHRISAIHTENRCNLCGEIEEVYGV